MIIGGYRLQTDNWWWLRSQGDNPNNAAIVNNDGSVNSNGNNVNNDNGVRPALALIARSLKPMREDQRTRTKEPDPRPGGSRHGVIRSATNHRQR